MKRHKTAYELRESQVQTPHEVVSLFWKLLHRQRATLGRVLDMGAGDGRFAIGGNYRHYEGVEIDPDAYTKVELPKHAILSGGCVFRYPGTNYEACIGNVPYVRHHDIEIPWKIKTTERIRQELGIDIDKHGNLYLYFMALGFIKTHSTGVVSLLLPFEWVSRPSAAAIRDYISEKKWDVSIYRFQKSIFPGVLTTASISIIDKNGSDSKWRFFDVGSDLKIKSRSGLSGTKYKILAHSDRGEIWARRGMSPGSQKIFTLTEGERIHAGLTKNDVIPCVTTLRGVPNSLQVLSWPVFNKYLVSKNQKCWLIRSSGKKISDRLKGYLNGIPKEHRQTYTCKNQKPWYAYEQAPVPKLLFHSCFTQFGPKVLLNSIGACAVGSVYGINADTDISTRKLQSHLLAFNFEKRVVAHAKSLKKIEVRQLNTVLSTWAKKSSRHGKPKTRQR